MDLDTSQLAAVEAALAGRGVRIITGGAGTGKTTIIKTIIDRLGGRADLLAPTGKAAARLREATGYDAGTLHRWLQWNGDSICRQTPAYYPLIVDEASMLDSWLLSQPLRFDPPKIILVGDPAQLPPVGKGSPFHDAVALRPDLVSHLTTCHRAKAAIHVAASQIRAGEMPPMDACTEGESWRMVETGGPDETEEVVLGWVKKGLFDPMQDVVLACRNGEHEDDAGSVRGLNDRLVAILNPREGEEPWKIGDRVMGLKNDSDLDWWNGDCGTVKAIDAAGDLWVQPDRPGTTEIRLDKLHRTPLKTLALAYALTVHKSQGSQYRRVFFLVFEGQSRMLNRNLIYTAVTRSRKGCVVLGQLGALRRGLRTVAHKTTALQMLLGQNQG